VDGAPPDDPRPGILMGGIYEVSRVWFHPGATIELQVLWQSDESHRVRVQSERLAAAGGVDAKE
jgi:hypothetical protein